MQASHHAANHSLTRVAPSIDEKKSGFDLVINRLLNIWLYILQKGEIRHFPLQESTLLKIWAESYVACAHRRQPLRLFFASLARSITIHSKNECLSSRLRAE